jgi:diguanylate cyclase (GGDEF)-like protein
VTVLRRDIAGSEPIHNGAGWTSYDAPTRPAGPNPLARNGHAQLAERAGRLDHPPVDRQHADHQHADPQRAEGPRIEGPRGEGPRVDQQRPGLPYSDQPRRDPNQIERPDQVERLVQAERLAHTERLTHTERLAPSERLDQTERLAKADRIVAAERATQADPTAEDERMAQIQRVEQLERLTQLGSVEQLGSMEQLDRPRTGETADSSKLIRLHESIAGLLASRGEWRQAYQHLRSALDLVYSDRVEQSPVPEQLRREVDRLRREHAEAREQSIRDSLTASYNRRYLDQRLTSLLADTAAPDAHDGLAVALVDLDWFKQVNDTFGHLVGDRVLQRVVELLSDALPEDAFCARYGGEEFVLVVPGIDAPTAVAVAEAARARVEGNAWSQLVPGLRVTVSVGLAHQAATGAAAGRPPTSAEQQLLRADGLLYAAKQSGRNAVAYRHAGRVLLAGAAADRRRIAEPRAAVTPER